MIQNAQAVLKIFSIIFLLPLEGDPIAKLPIKRATPSIRQRGKTGIWAEVAVVFPDTVFVSQIDGSP